MSDSIDGERPPPRRFGSRRFSPTQLTAMYTLGAGVLIAAVFARDPGDAAPPPEPERPRFSIREVIQPEMLPAPAPLPVPPPLPAAPPATPVLALPPASGASLSKSRMLSFPSPPAAPQLAAAQAAPAAVPLAETPLQGARTRTSVAFAPSTIQGGRAGPALDLTFVLVPGLYKCVLESRVSSEQNGYFFCHTVQDIHSPAGVVLMEAGTRITGQYFSNVRQGQTRIMALSVMALTPKGVPVPLGAPVGGPVGDTGLEGAVDSHFWARFGGATLLLLSEGAINAATATLQSGSGNNSVNIGGSAPVFQGVVAETLRGSIAIPPTIVKNQGEEVTFFVTAPVSFEDAYTLRHAPAAAQP